MRGSLLSRIRSAVAAGYYAVALSFLFLCFFGTFQLCLVMLGLRQRFDAVLDEVGTRLAHLGGCLPTALVTVSFQQFVSAWLAGFGRPAWHGDGSGPGLLSISEPSAPLRVEPGLAERPGKHTRAEEGMWPVLPSALVTLVSCALQRPLMELLKPATAKLAKTLFP